MLKIGTEADPKLFKFPHTNAILDHVCWNSANGITIGQAVGKHPLKGLTSTLDFT